MKSDFWHLLLRSLLVTSKALVTRSDALVTTSFRKFYFANRL